MTELLLFAVGIIIGSMNAIAGGGMLLGFPALIAAGLTPLAANITGCLVVFPGQLSSAYSYRKYLRKLSPQYLLLLIPCLVGAFIGSTVLRHTSTTRFQEIVPGLIFLAVLLFAFQPYLHFHLRKHITTRSHNITRLLLISLGILPIATYGAFFGPGFGFVMLAFLGFARLPDIHQINGLKNIAGATISGVALLNLLSTHLIDWKFGLAMAVGTTIGGFVGARFSQRFSSHAIRIVVIIIGLVAATYLAFHSY